MRQQDQKAPAPTGNPWQPSEPDPATVPVPLPVIIVKVEGPYTERDRKLWTFLLHAVWDELGVQPVHELAVAKVNQVFRDLGGEHDTQWIWECAGRLTRTIVEWERTEGDDRYQGVASLFQAEIGTSAKTLGILRFAFPPLLIPILKEPRRFARLRVHFLIGLSGKYAVTLYELLEGVANKIDPILDVSLATLRQWLKVPAGKLSRYQDFRRYVLEPALQQINANPLGSGFTVDVQALKKSRAIDRLRFTVRKANERLALEDALREGSATRSGRRHSPVNHSPEPLLARVHLSPSDYEKAGTAAPGWDIYALESQWRAWIADKESPTRPGAAFVAFCRKKFQQQGRP